MMKRIPEQTGPTATSGPYRWRRCILALVASLLAGGCGSDHHHESDGSFDGGSQLPTSEVLPRLEQAQGQIYSFLFLDNPADPMNVGAHLVIQDASAAQGCGRYSKRTGLVTTEDFWALDVLVSRATAGVSPVIYDSHIHPGSTTLAAEVQLVHARDGAFTGNYPAVEGTVTLDEGMTLERWWAGASLVGTLDVSFPVHAVQQISCVGGQSATGEGYSNVCSCLDADGVSGQCHLELEHANCCADVQSARQAVHIRFAAAQCSDVCLSAAPNDFCGLLDGASDGGIADATSSDSGGSCGDPSCTGLWWPHLVVVNESGDSNTDDWSVYTTDGAGSNVALLRQPCPRSTTAPQLACDFGSFVLPDVQPITVHVDSPRGSLERALSLPASSRVCASSIVRLRALPSVDGSLLLSDPEVINPCAP